MEEEVFVRENGDELEQLIAARLGARRQKLDRMAQWEKPKKVVRLTPAIVALAVAACLALVLVIVPLVGSSPSLIDEMGIGSPATESFRAASPEMAEIARLIEMQSYAEALAKTEEALKHSDMSIEELGDLGDIWDDEELQYETQMEYANNSEIRWTYIYLLLQVDRKKEARRELKRYLRQPDYCSHQAEAEALLGKLKN